MSKGIVQNILQYLIFRICKGVYDSIHYIYEYHRRENRESDFPELLPFGGALHLGCLKQRAWNRLQGGKEYEDLYTGGIDHTVSIVHRVYYHSGKGAVQVRRLKQGPQVKEGGDVPRKRR
mgnify:CR=1 FL=1